MPDFRVFCTPPTPEPAEITLSADESHHLVAVNRARAGDTVIAFDGRGTEWTCQLTSDRKQAAVLRVLSRQMRTPLACALTLAQALPKGSAMDGIVRKATEIGAARIIPLETDRTEVHLERERADRKLDKWRTAALEAAKQCGNPFVPEIRPVETFGSLVASAHDYELKLIASLAGGARSLKPALAAFRETHQRPPKSVLWLVGPEGDFTPAETSIALAQGFEPITLGPLVLRCETAATYALSILSYELLSG